jgi:hypothetical protein
MRHRTEPLVVEATDANEIPQSPSLAKAWNHSGRIDFRRLDASLLVLGGATLLLFVALQLPWYTFSVPGRRTPTTGSASAMIAGGWRYVIWAFALATLLLLFLESVTTWKRPSWLRRYEVLLTVAVVDLALVIVAGLVSKGVPPHHAVTVVRSGAIDTAIGAWVALGAAAVAVGAATAGLADNGVARLAGVRVRLPVTGVRSPITGVRSPIIRERPAGEGAPLAAEASVGVSVGVPVEEPAAPVPEAFVEPVAEPVAEAFAEPAADAFVEPAVEPVVESAVEPVVEPAAAFEQHEYPEYWAGAQGAEPEALAESPRAETRSAGAGGFGAVGARLKSAFGGLRHRFAVSGHEAGEAPADGEPAEYGEPAQYGETAESADHSETPAIWSGEYAPAEEYVPVGEYVAPAEEYVPPDEYVAPAEEYVPPAEYVAPADAPADLAEEAPAETWAGTEAWTGQEQWTGQQEWTGQEEWTGGSSEQTGGGAAEYTGDWQDNTYAYPEVGAAPEVGATPEVGAHEEAAPEQAWEAGTTEAGGGEAEEWAPESAAPAPTEPSV